MADPSTVPSSTTCCRESELILSALRPIPTFGALERPTSHPKVGQSSASRRGHMAARRNTAMKIDFRMVDPRNKEKIGYSSVVDNGRSNSDCPAPGLAAVVHVRAWGGRRGVNAKTSEWSSCSTCFPRCHDWAERATCPMRGCPCGAAAARLQWPPMFMSVTPYAAVLWASSAISLVVAIVALRRRRPARGGRVFALMMCAVVFWALMSGFGAAAAGMSSKVLFGKMGYICAACVAPLFLVFAIQHNGGSALRSPLRMALLWTIPVASILLAATNEWHRLVWASQVPSTVAG